MCDCVLQIEEIIMHVVICLHTTMNTYVVFHLQWLIPHSTNRKSTYTGVQRNRRTLQQVKLQLQILNGSVSTYVLLNKVIVISPHNPIRPGTFHCLFAVEQTIGMSHRNLPRMCFQAFITVDPRVCLSSLSLTLSTSKLQDLFTSIN